MKKIVRIKLIWILDQFYVTQFLPMDVNCDIIDYNGGARGTDLKTEKYSRCFFKEIYVRILRRR